MEDWRSFQADIIQEKKAVESIKYMLSGMNSNTSAVISKTDKQIPYYNNNSMNYDDSSFRISNSNFRATNRGFSANRGKPNSQAYQQKQFKDPDIW